MNNFRKRTGKILVWLICAVLVMSAFTVVFAENDKSTNKDYGIKSEPETAQNAESVSSGNEDSDAVDNPNAVVEDKSTVEEHVIKEETKTTKVDFSSFKDASNHWAKDNLKKAVADGLLTGFEDGTLRPDAKITLAQMVTIIVRILKPELMEDSGVPDGKWYTEAANKAAALGIISSSDAGSINSAINRKAACEMIAEAFQLVSANPDRTTAAQYSDFGDLPLTEKIVFASLVEGGYMEGYGGSLMLSNSITRAEFVTILYRIAGTYSSGDISNSGATVLSSKNVEMFGLNITGDLWIDATAENVVLDNVSAKNIVIRSDFLNNLKVIQSSINRLVIAARNGALDLDCSGIDTTVVGSGGDRVTLNPEGNSVEITGSGRNIVISGGAKSVNISGNNNTIVFDKAADTNSVVINGESNMIYINSGVASLKLYGKQNILKGSGEIDLLTLYTDKSAISVSIGTKVDLVDHGIDGMTAALYGPDMAYQDKYMIVNGILTNTPIDAKKVELTWTINDKVVKTDRIFLDSDTKLQLDYYISSTMILTENLEIGLTLKYITNEGDVQVVTAKPASVPADPVAIKKQAAAVLSIETVYKGNRTTKWAIDHDYSKETKELFVNLKGYSSSSKYLIWVNIGTQHTMVFEGSQGNWKLIRSGLVSTGAGDATPRGIFQTTYKQTNWTTENYTVKPVVRFYTGGFAFHSRLYQPGTTTLKGGANGVGYPLSHGCVRMQADDINWLYNNVPDGTTVVIY